MVRLRKILFALFVVIYLILCPTLILYSLGIVITPGKKKVVKTGIIYISSIPSGVPIFLNGSPTNEETPTALSNLMPGTYKLELSAKKYHPWQKMVTVSAEKVVPIENILLIPDPLNIKELSTTVFERLMPVAGNPYLLVATGPKLTDIFFYIWDEGLTQNLMADNETNSSTKLRPVVPADIPDGDAKPTRLHTAKGSPYLLFEIENNGNKKLLWIDPLFGTPKIEDITDLFPDVPTEIHWDANDPRHLLTFQNNAINRLDLATKAIYPKILDGIEAFSQTGQDVTFITQDREVKSASATGTNPEPVSDEVMFNELVFEHFPFKHLLSVSNHLTILLGSRGQLLATFKPYLLADGNIEEFKWNDKPPRLLIWSKTSIGFINMPRRSDSLDEEVPGHINWITQKGLNINDAFWVNDGSNILYVDRNKIFLADTGSAGTPRIEEIIEIKAESRIYYSDKIGKAFFLNTIGHLSSVEIVPQKTLLRGIKFESKAKDEE